MVDQLLALGFLVASGAASGAAAPDASLAVGGFASVLAHHQMLYDHLRVLSYKAAISRHANGKTVVEVGCGTGVLSLFAARYGAQHVTAIEESAIAGIAREMFRANGCADRIDLRLGHSRDIKLDAPADLIIHEIIGTDPFAENVLPIIADARERFMKKGGRLLPHRLEVFCLGFEVEDRPFRDRARHLAEIREFSGLYGLDFSPFARAIGALPNNSFRRPWDLGDAASFRPRILTDECRLVDIDLYRDFVDVPSRIKNVEMTISKAGVLGGVLLCFRAHLDDESHITNSPYVPLTSWGRDARPLSRLVPVAEGERIGLSVSLRTVLGIQRIEIGLQE